MADSELKEIGATDVGLLREQYLTPSRVRALDLSFNREVHPNEIARVARDTSDEAAQWAFTQWELRDRGRDKFARAERMLFVREALEQATHEALADYHAAKFRKGVRVVDLTAGIGGDLIGLAGRGPATGYEIDAERAVCALHNLRAYGREAEIFVKSGLSEPWTFDYAIADPSRRVGGRRTVNPQGFEPDPLEIAQRFKAIRLGLIKLSPMMEDAFLKSLGPGLEFLSYGRECREALIITGRDAPTGTWAVHVETGERLETGIASGDRELPDLYLYDSDPAAIRAHALGTLSRQMKLKPLGTSNGYLTGPEVVKSPWLRGYEVLYAGRPDLDKTIFGLRELDARVVEVKVRSADVDGQRLLREFPTRGRRPVSLVVYGLGKSMRHALAVPL